MSFLESSQSVWGCVVLGLLVVGSGRRAVAQAPSTESNEARMGHAVLKIRDGDLEAAAMHLRLARLAMAVDAELTERLVELSGECESAWADNDAARLAAAGHLVEVAEDCAELQRPRTALRLLRDARAIDPRAGQTLQEKLAATVSPADARLPHFAAELAADITACLATAAPALDEDDADGATLAWLEARRRLVAVTERGDLRRLQREIDALGRKLGDLVKDITKAEGTAARDLVTLNRRYHRDRWQRTEVHTTQVPASWGDRNAVKACDAALRQFTTTGTMRLLGGGNMTRLFYTLPEGWQWRREAVLSPPLTTPDTQLLLPSRAVRTGRDMHGHLRLRLPPSGGVAGMKLGSNMSGVLLRAERIGLEIRLHVMESAPGQPPVTLGGDTVVLEAGVAPPDLLEFTLRGADLTVGYGPAEVRVQIEPRVLGLRAGLQVMRVFLMLACVEDVGALPEGEVFEELWIEAL